MEDFLKSMVLLVALVGLLKVFEIFTLGRRRFICKKCGKPKTYFEMDSFNFCNNCEHDR